MSAAFAQRHDVFGRAHRTALLGRTSDVPSEKEGVFLLFPGSVA